MIEKTFVYFDVGAAPEGLNIYSFPLNDPEKHKYLKKYIGIDPLFETAKNDGKYHYYNCAVGKEEGERLFYVTQYKENSSFFVPTIPGKNNRLSITDQKFIKCVNFSTIIDQEGGCIDILKIDTQGSELEILESIPKYMNDIYAIHIELWCSYVAYKDIPLLDKIHNLLSSFCFVPYKLINTFKHSREVADVLYFNENKLENVEKIKQLYDFYDIVVGDKKTARHHVLKMLKRMGK
jgi:FkbM family methyltransferase